LPNRLRFEGQGETRWWEWTKPEAFLEPPQPPILATTQFAFPMPLVDPSLHPYGMHGTPLGLHCKAMQKGVGAPSGPCPCEASCQPLVQSGFACCIALRCTGKAPQAKPCNAQDLQCVAIAFFT
jgi:hypothetical protein